MKSSMLESIPISLLMGKYKIQNKKLAKIGLHTVQDLLLHLPLRYENHEHLKFINDLLPDVYATVVGTIISCNVTFNKRQMMICKISDGFDTLILRFFNYNFSMKNSLIVGKTILVFGKIKLSKYGKEMLHPKYHIQDNFKFTKLQSTLIPVYPTTSGIKQNILRKLIDKALNLLNTYTITELLPPEITHNMISISEALHVLHRPPSNLQTNELKNYQLSAHKRLILEELLAHNLSMLILRTNIQNTHAPSLPACDELKNKLLSSLTFTLTSAQKRVIAEIEHDMTLNVPMMRLIQGDVGSGKTLVAALAALRAITHNKQVVLLTPTELLAEQHADNFRNWFQPLGIEVCLLVGKQKNSRIRLAQKDAIITGKIKMLVGTHAVFQEQIQFSCLALIIIDEQHRFGVHQRLTLWKKGKYSGLYPHQLIMTATPIPRTLAMTVYANLNTSVIDEIPLGRASVTTVVIPDIRRDDVIKHIRDICMQEGRQVYWVCTLIEQSELFKVQAAKGILKILQLSLPELKIGLMHGRMKSIEKQLVITKFRRGQLNILVTTTVIEVGIDIPNASLMVIENSERLGLAQLHQLRGRIGRGLLASYCIMLYKAPLSIQAQKRLQVLRDSNNGLLIAQKDLEIRGPGEILGTRQTGNIEFKVANFPRDQKLIPEIQKIARYMYDRYPEQSIALINRWVTKTEHYYNA